MSHLKIAHHDMSELLKVQRLSSFFPFMFKLLDYRCICLSDIPFDMSLFIMLKTASDSLLGAFMIHTVMNCWPYTV